ncbi:MAG: TlpA disulfide reductase family protein [Thermomicrobiales bacterium]
MGDAQASPAPLPDSDPPDDEDADHGRVGYGRLGRYSPLILGLIILAVVAGIWVVQRNQPSGEPTMANRVSEAAPDVSLTLLNGDTLDLGDLRGNVVVLNFWASWCGPCRVEMPELQAFWEEAQQSGEATRVIGVGVRTDTDADARKFVADGGYTYPIGRDTNTDQPGIGPIETAFGIPSAYPATIIIRRDGTIDRYHLGPVTAAMLRLMVDEARTRAQG